MMIKINRRTMIVMENTMADNMPKKTATTTTTTTTTTQTTTTTYNTKKIKKDKLNIEKSK